MSTILFDCDATEFEVTPPKENNENNFALCEKSLIINIMQSDNILMQTEISKNDALELAKLIIFKYGMKC